MVFVKGIVLDADTGQPVGGCAVSAAWSSISNTNENGEFFATINGASSGALVEFMFFKKGYIPRSDRIPASENISVKISKRSEKSDQSEKSEYSTVSAGFSIESLDDVHAAKYLYEFPILLRSQEEVGSVVTGVGTENGFVTVYTNDPDRTAIDDNIGGIPIRVRYMPEIRLQYGYSSCNTCGESDPSGSCSPNRVLRIRPITGGISCGLNNDSGTIGCFATDRINGDTYILSNNHVLAENYVDLIEAPAGSPIYQPGGADDLEVTGNKVGELTRWIPFNIGDTENYADAAIAKVDAGVQFSQGVLSDSGNIAPIIGVRRYPVGGANGVNIIKCGRTTGENRGYVSDDNFTIRVGYSYGDATIPLIFTDQLKIECFVCGGDSGGAIVNTDGEIIGLNFAGVANPEAPMGTVAFANKISYVEDMLGINILTTPLNTTYTVDVGTGLPGYIQNSEFEVQYMVKSTNPSPKDLEIELQVRRSDNDSIISSSGPIPVPIYGKQVEVGWVTFGGISEVGEYKLCGVVL